MTRLDPDAGPLLREVHHSSPDLLRALIAFEAQNATTHCRLAAVHLSLVPAPKRQEEVR